MTTKAEIKSSILNENVARIIKGLTEIGAFEIEDFKMNLAISRTIANLSLIEKAFSKSVQALNKQYVSKTDTGAFSITNGYYDFDTTANRDEHEKKTIELNETPLEPRVQIWMLKTSALKNIKNSRGIAKSMALCHELIEDDGNILPAPAEPEQ